MRLYFFRHAIAQDPDGIILDHDRALTNEGILRTRRSARLIKMLGVVPDHLYSSPLLRARQTAEILAITLGVAVQVREEVAPGFNRAAVERLTHDLGDDAEVMFIGHEPDFSTTICELTGARVEVKKGSLFRVDLACYQPLEGNLTLALSPKVFQRLG